jgi:hypothetical protein
MFLETIEVEKPTTTSDCLSALALVGVLGFDRRTQESSSCACRLKYQNSEIRICTDYFKYISTRVEVPDGIFTRTYHKVSFSGVLATVRYPDDAETTDSS